MGCVAHKDNNLKILVQYKPYENKLSEITTTYDVRWNTVDKYKIFMDGVTLHSNAKYDNGKYKIDGDSISYVEMDDVVFYTADEKILVVRSKG